MGMSPKRPVVVHPPSPGGRRRVTVEAVNLGLAQEPRDVEEFLRRAGLEDVDARTSDLIEWRGGGPDVWPE